ncbi:cell envelope integrity protein TolA [Sulfurifustis variabilis]|nr:cell envelope integrity protein TolA [Sulfurifustis variabilis]
MMRKDRRQPGGMRALVLAVLVHLAVVGIVVVGFQYTAAPTAPVAQPIQATVVEDPRKLEAERKRQEESRRKGEAEQRQKEEDARRRAEEQKRLEEQRRVEEQKRVAQQKQQEEQRRAEEARRKAEAERKRQEEARMKAEAEQKQREAEQRKKEEETRRKAAEESLREQLAMEEQAREQARREQELQRRAATAMSQYEGAIKQKVSRNWVLPVGVPEGLKCTVRVRLLPGGEVVEATVIGPSGNALFDRSVEVAVRKASPLPIATDPELFPYFRDIKFNFDPAKDKG